MKKKKLGSRENGGRYFKPSHNYAVILDANETMYSTYSETHKLG